MRSAAGILAIAASGFACVGVEPPPIPACDAAVSRPPPEASCELSEEVADYKHDTVLTVWGYVGSSVPRLALVLDFDARARVAGVCAERGVRVSRRSRPELERAVRALRSMPPAPRCLAGTSLDLREEFASATSGRRRRGPEVEELCFPGQQSCAGWREPVCALLNDGSRRTYPDECAACRDPSVTGYDEGSCAGLY